MADLLNPTWQSKDAAQQANKLIDDMLGEAVFLMTKAQSYHMPKLEAFDAGTKYLGLNDDALTITGMTAAHRIAKYRLEENSRGFYREETVLQAILERCFRKKISFSEEQAIYLCEWCLQLLTTRGYALPVAGVVGAIVRTINATKESPLRAEAERLVNLFGQLDQKEYRKPCTELVDALGLEAPIPVNPHELWSDYLISEIKALPKAEQRAWISLLTHCKTATGGKPNGKWLKKAETFTNDSILANFFNQRVVKWFELAEKPNDENRQRAHGWSGALDPMEITDGNQDVLKGLMWFTTLAQDSETGRAVAQLAISCYNKKIPGVGPRAPRIGNAAVWALGEFEGLDGIGHLAYLKVRVRYGTAQKQIEKALNKKAESLGITRGELEEMSVPDYGLTAIGSAEYMFGSCRAIMQCASANKVELKWFNDKGKEQKSIPASVKNEYADELKDLKGAVKDLQKMLPAQRERLDNLFLQRRTWPAATWEERYSNHPLVGFLSRRLIWVSEREGISTPFLMTKNGPVDVNGATVDIDSTIIHLWHPIESEQDEILAWRSRLTELEVVQPFKQAHREIYLVTDAERATDVYSNRYAAHIIKQHQFNSLCAARGWKNSLRLMVDDEYPPASRSLEQWNIRAEYWIEGAGDNYGVDTNEAGTFLFLTTDQVRFYAINAPTHTAHAGGGGYSVDRWGPAGDGNPDPLKMDDIPPLVFSEIMRDCDLFVGVASIANDPNWHDHGPETRPYDTYWQNVSFGELSGTGENRKEILENLIPKLAIADKCTFEGRFLRVQGTIRNYRIHLGSGNILMEPNDQYLCIVPKQSTRKSDQVMLPFEGDNMMSIILSKALMLAKDDKITDKTIISQIQKR